MDREILERICRELAENLPQAVVTAVFDGYDYRVFNHHDLNYAITEKKI